MIVDLTKNEILTIIKALEEFKEAHEDDANAYSYLSEYEAQCLLMELKLKERKMFD